MKRSLIVGPNRVPGRRLSDTRLAADKTETCGPCFKAHARFLFLFSSVFESGAKLRETEGEGDKVQQKNKKKQHKLHVRLTKTNWTKTMKWRILGSTVPLLFLGVTDYDVENEFDRALEAASDRCRCVFRNSVSNECLILHLPFHFFSFS